MNLYSYTYPPTATQRRAKNQLNVRMNKPNAGTAAPKTGKEAAGASEVVVRLYVNVRPARLRRHRHPRGGPCGEVRSIESVAPSSLPQARASGRQCRECSRACSADRPSARTTMAAQRALREPARRRYNPRQKVGHTCSRLHPRAPHRARGSPRRPVPGGGFS